jgi:hypothetical protein
VCPPMKMNGQLQIAFHQQELINFRISFFDKILDMIKNKCSHIKLVRNIQESVDRFNCINF